MSEWAARRFWTDVTVEEVAGGLGVLLDGRRVMTPGKLPLTFPNRTLAGHVAAEWKAVEKLIDPSVMPWTRSANSAVEKVMPQMDDVAAHLAEYAETDLLSYRAEGPLELVLQQSATWDPILDWAAEDHGGRLDVTTGVMPVAQDAAVIEALTRKARELDAWELTAFHDLVTLGGSYIVALHLLSQPERVEEMWRATRIDEDWQAEQWGLDEEAAAESDLKRHAFFHAVAFLQAARAN
jgi:chaperone required for assembly of F1-ATPase